MTIIGLSGYARCGKDSVANILVELGWHRMSFADRLKLAVKELDPIIDGITDYSLSMYWDDTKSTTENWDYLKDNFPEVRRMLQRMGTEVGRKLFGDNFWVQQAFAAIPEGTHRVVFTDCRFPNEAASVRARGGELWRVNRPGFGPVNGHASETSLDDYTFDVIIDNDGTLDDLHNQVCDRVSELAYEGTRL